MRNPKRLIPTAILFTMILSLSTYSQSAAAGKVGLIDLFALGGKGGVTKYVAALKKLDAEFITEIKSLQTKVKTIEAKAKAFDQLRSANPKTPPATLQAKASELDQLRRDAKFKQEDLQARINARRQVIIGPVWVDMKKALKTYATQKGYAVILDGSKLEESGLLMAFDNKYNVTKDFITYYNSRPAGTASVNP